MGSGGPNGGSQYNPNKISAMGGDGQSGKKAAKAMELRPSGGGAKGATQALTQQIAGAKGVVGTAPAAVKMNVQPEQVNPLVGITAPSGRSEEDITAGSIANPVGMVTPGPESLMLPGGGAGDAKFNNNIQAYYPVIAYISGRDDTSEDTRQILNTLMRGINPIAGGTV